MAINKDIIKILIIPVMVFILSCTNQEEYKSDNVKYESLLTTRSRIYSNDGICPRGSKCFSDWIKQNSSIDDNTSVQCVNFLGEPDESCYYGLWTYKHLYNLNDISHANG